MKYVTNVKLHIYFFLGINPRVPSSQQRPEIRVPPPKNDAFVPVYKPQYADKRADKASEKRPAPLEEESEEYDD